MPCVDKHQWLSAVKFPTKTNLLNILIVKSCEIPICWVNFFQHFGFKSPVPQIRCRCGGRFRPRRRDHPGGESGGRDGGAQRQGAGAHLRDLCAAGKPLGQLRENREVKGKSEVK